MLEIPRIQDADLKGKIVLVRVDHNVAKQHVIKDPFRIDVTFGTLFNILSKGGKLILMSHVGRPRNKKTEKIDMNSKYDVKPIVDYLYKKLYTKFIVPDFKEDKVNGGFIGIDTAVNLLIKRLRKGEIDGIYLPNIRWFKGEESGGIDSEKLGEQLAGLADVYVNDAFGSWQPHTSTIKPAIYLPSYAGYLMQHEIESLDRIYNPVNPMLAIIAGSKFDTKIGPLHSLLKKVDKLIMGGVIYNAYLSAKYGFKIKGIDEEDLNIARKFLEISEQYPNKILEPSILVESDTMEGKIEGSYRFHNINDLPKGAKLNYIVDVAPASFDCPKIREAILGSRTVFVNAVMGYMPHFFEGTKTMYSLIDENKTANKLFGGGDTLQEFRSLLPGTYISATDNPNYYFFSGGGTILKAIHEGCVTGLEPVKALIQNGRMWQHK
ncbi:MAG: phosphoglycerate kinase [Candidatus Cloacimonadota bacterium]|nr:MAG: phosphoglycerate kinase [Candidatus Cloacimonadota bacterium]